MSATERSVSRDESEMEMLPSCSMPNRANVNAEMVGDLTSGEQAIRGRNHGGSPERRGMAKLVELHGEFSHHYLL